MKRSYPVYQESICYYISIYLSIHWFGLLVVGGKSILNRECRRDCLLEIRMRETMDRVRNIVEDALIREDGFRTELDF